MGAPLQCRVIIRNFQYVETYGKTIEQRTYIGVSGMGAAGSREDIVVNVSMAVYNKQKRGEH